jgi:hypothetical protein
MSFGLLKHFKDIKKNSIIPSINAHMEHLILGDDLESVLKLVELKKHRPSTSLRLISSRNLTRQSLIETYDFMPTLLRSEEQVATLYKTYFDAKIFSEKKDPVFFKEGKFYDFRGRAKSMDLQSGEDLFLKKGFKLNIASLFSPEDWENLDEILREHQKIAIIESIDKSTPNDLVEKAEWKIAFKDFSIITCENLYLGISPKKFLNYLEHKENLTSELIDFTSSIQHRSGLVISWVLDKEIHPDHQTIFVPQSMTHEWGHFIVEFDTYSYEHKTQMCHALILIHHEEPQTDELGAKIKLLKRVLDRVFPQFENHIKKEFIRFDEELFTKNFREELRDQLLFDYPTLHFLKNTLIHH